MFLSAHIAAAGIPKAGSVSALFGLSWGKPQTRAYAQHGAEGIWLYIWPMTNPLLKNSLFRVLATVMTLLFVLTFASASWELFGAPKTNMLLSVKEWQGLIQLYQFPLSIAVGFFALVGLFTAYYRVSLQAEQTYLQSQQTAEAQKLNVFNIYFKQRDEFDKKFLTSMGEWHKAVHHNINVRNHEWFDDFDVTKSWDLEIEADKLKRIEGIACFNLYEFCFGSGRSISLTKEFSEYTFQIFSGIELLSKVKDESEILECKAKLNALVVGRLSKSGKFSDWCMLYNSEWFSINEKFNLTLAVARLFAEIEAFAGQPRSIECIDMVISSGQSAEHALFFGPNLIMGELMKSLGGSQGRVPNLASHLFGPGPPPGRRFFA